MIGGQSLAHIVAICPPSLWPIEQGLLTQAGDQSGTERIDSA